MLGLFLTRLLRPLSKLVAQKCPNQLGRWQCSSQGCCNVPRRHCRGNVDFSSQRRLRCRCGTACRRTPQRRWRWPCGTRCRTSLSTPRTSSTSWSPWSRLPSSRWPSCGLHLCKSQSCLTPCCATARPPLFLGSLSLKSCITCCSTAHTAGAQAQQAASAGVAGSCCRMR